jgi:hypothetical protein
MLLSKIFARNNYRAILDPLQDHEFSVHVSSSTARFIVNSRHKGNGKTRVARAWREASGQQIEVDPTIYEGLIVEKSNANATHDGRILEGPIGPDGMVPGKVYQMLIDNSSGSDVVDLRVTFHGDSIPLVYIKKRPITSRFSNDNTGVEIVESNTVFDESEQKTLLRFAHLAGLDFGEADVLRDNRSGLIWVVDSTNGPSGPPNGLSPSSKKLAVERLSAAFDRMLSSA